MPAVSSTSEGVSPPLHPAPQRVGVSPPSTLPPFLIDYVGGVLGGISVTVVGHPFDTVKVRLQTALSGSYTSTLDCIKQTYRHSGLAGFYAGVTSPILGQMWFRAGSFASFHYISSLLPPPSPEEKYTYLLLSGALTGAVITPLETPIDVVKTKLQVLNLSYPPPRPRPYSDASTCARFLLDKYGKRGLFHGQTGTLVRNVPANAVFFPVNEILKDRCVSFRGYGSVGEMRTWERVVCGGAAGFCYWVGTCPLDCVKSQMMMTRQSDVPRPSSV
eukprot:CAMPEP_0197547278 /NCGR_PEP_ID=MMETSP1320-20131121/1662_1 /TAXON_ID=91990 /ORGANISM="Bolidomonas sp., Strain RCC2347" /LENGTH=273 /DNA_ID=CAMNT_0043107023 /DNA_START=128 /DNA_END=946 /DNA_ORIENTATION=-